MMMYMIKHDVIILKYISNYIFAYKRYFIICLLIQKYKQK